MYLAKRLFRTVFLAVVVMEAFSHTSSGKLVLCATEICVNFQLLFEILRRHRTALMDVETKIDCSYK
jgi:hypothetical protein